MKSRLYVTTLAVLYAVLWIGPAVAQAQEPTVVQIQYLADASLPPLGLDLELASNGQVRGELRSLDGLSGLVLKRGVVGALPEGEMAASYASRISRDTSAGPAPVGEVTVSLHGRSDGAGKATEPFLVDLRVEPDANGGVAMLAWDAAGLLDSEPEVLELRFSPSSSVEWLRGEPSHLFNEPGPGEDLVARFPAPTPGATAIEVLTVHPSGETTSPAQFRVKIKHTI